MKSLLIIPKQNNNTGVDFDYTFPIGFAYIVSILKHNNFPVDVINLNHFLGSHREILKSRIEGYDIIMSGGLEGLFLQLVDLFHFLRQETNATLIIGGSLLNGSLDLTFPLIGADIGVIGEGEISTIELFECLSQKKDYSHVLSIAFFKDGQLQINPRRKQISNLDEIPFPDLDALDFKTHLDNASCNTSYYTCVTDFPRIYPIYTSRGCPHSCTFCIQTMGNHYVLRSIDSVIEELEQNIPKYNINIVVLIDSLLGNSKERVIEFCTKFQALRKRLSSNCLWFANFTGSIIDNDLLDLIIESGCYMLSIGYESYSTEILKSMKKPISKDIIDRSFDMIMNKRIALQANFLFGDIEETRESIEQNLKYIKKKAKGQIDPITINPSLGTKLLESYQQNHLIRSILKYLINLSISYHYRGTFITFKSRHISTFQKYRMIRKMFLFRNKYFAIAFVTLKKQKERYSISFTCPLCKTQQQYNNISASGWGRFNFFGMCRHCRKRVLFLSKLYYIIVKFVPFYFEIWFMQKKLAFLLHKIKIFLNPNTKKEIRKKILPL